MFGYKSAMAAALAAVVARVGAVDIVVAATGGNMTSPIMYGLMHEDINYSGDGGLYAELIRNRAFQGSELYPVSLDYYSPLNGAELSLMELEEPLSSALPWSMNVAAPADAGMVGFENSGFWGMDVRVVNYTGSFWVKGDYEGVFVAEFRSALSNEIWGSVEVESKATSEEWVEHEYVLVPDMEAPYANNTFALTFDAAGAASGSLDFNLISVFPPTYKGRKNGLRIDLAEALEQLNPKFLRLPGGNMLEGNTNETLWRWENTIGPLRERPGFDGVWGYPQTNGMGLIEYMHWSEDMGLERILGVWDGLALNGDVTPKDELDQWIQYALDELEFLMGDVSTPWGAVRAELGYPEGWEIRYVEVGNEDWLAGGEYGWETYQEYRFPMFMNAILEKYPDMIVIASGSKFEGYDAIPFPGVGDYHSYPEPDALIDQFDLFDDLTKDNLTIVGEVAAVHPNGGIGWDGDLMPFPWWQGAVSEGIFMFGVERNTDRVLASTYAPILRNMNSWSWAVTLLQYEADVSKTMRSTSWYVWELLANNLMTHNLPTTGDIDPVYYVAGENEDDGSFIWKGGVYNSTDGADVPISLKFEGVAPGTKARLTVLSGPEDPYAYNNPYTGENVVVTEKFIVTADDNSTFEFSLPDLSIAVLTTSRAECTASKKARKLRV